MKREQGANVKIFFLLILSNKGGRKLRYHLSSKLQLSQQGLLNASIISRILQGYFFGEEGNYN